MTRRVAGSNTPLFVFLFGLVLTVLGGISRDVLPAIWIHAMGGGFLITWIGIILNMVCNPVPPRRLGRGGF